MFFINADSLPLDYDVDILAGIPAYRHDAINIPVIILPYGFLLHREDLPVFHVVSLGMVYNRKILRVPKVGCRVIRTIIF